MNKILEWDNVKVGTGRKVHRMLRSSSQTSCGYWVGTHGICKVNSPCTCDKCGAD